MFKCFRCEKEIESLCEGSEDMPDKAVVFTGGDNYGSQIYDAVYDRVMVRLYICDDCLTKHKELITEYKFILKSDAEIEQLKTELQDDGVLKVPTTGTINVKFNEPTLLEPIDFERK